MCLITSSSVSTCFSILSAITETLTHLFTGYGERSSSYMFALVIILLFCSVFWVMKPRRPIYLIDYCCAKHLDTNKTSLEIMLFYLKSMDTVDDDAILFQRKVFLKSGIGEEAYVPRANLEKGRLLSMQDSYDQAHVVIVGAVDILLKKTGISPSQIDILVVNCGLFNPTPSLTSLLVNHFKLREDVKSFYLGGMGCSAGLIALKLAEDLLKVHKKVRYALVASAEVIQSFYDGKERAMMVTNCLFKSAGNALLLSNWGKDKERAKMELKHVVRVNTASQDDAHNVVVVKEDKEGKWGGSLSPQLIKVASEALTKNIERLAIQVLPVGELCKAGWNKMQRNILKKRQVKPYVPNFKLAFQHFCIHPGGKTVIEGVGRVLGLSMYDMEPSLMALHRFGNTSCSGVWYILAYMEAKGRLKKGEKVWQIGLGSGFKCTTAVWKVIRDMKFEETFLDNPWHDCIHRYPVLNDLASLPHVQSLLGAQQSRR